MIQPESDCINLKLISGYTEKPSLIKKKMSLADNYPEPIDLNENIKCNQPKLNKDDDDDTSSLSRDINIFDEFSQVLYYHPSQSSLEDGTLKNYVINIIEGVVEATDINSNEAICNEETSTREDIELSRVFKEPDEDYKSISDNISFKDCGEPMMTQYLRLDFTPVTEVDDDEFTVNKCLDFWKFIDGHPELKPLKVEPDMKDLEEESDSFMSVSTKSSTLSTGSSENDNKLGLTPLTVMSVNWLRKEDVMNDTFVAKQTGMLLCEPTLTEFDAYYERRKDNWRIIGTNHKHAESKHIPSLPSSTRQSQDSLATTNAADSLAQMMEEMHKWDLEHPKSLKPPGTMPVENKIDRKKSILPYIDTDSDKYCEKCLN